MILTEDMEAAYNTAKVHETDSTKLKDMLRELITEYAVRMAHTDTTPAFVEQTAKFMVDDLKKYYKHLRVGDMALAIRMHSNVADRREKPCVNTFKTAIDLYLNSKDRERFIQERQKSENEKAKAKMLESKTEWTSDEHASAMRGRYIENLNRVEQGKPVFDAGGLLFEHMVKNGIIEVTEEDRAELREIFMQKRKMRPLDVVIRDQFKAFEQSSGVDPNLREHVMTKYFRTEVEMRLEARKIQNQRNE